MPRTSIASKGIEFKEHMVLTVLTILHPDVTQN